MNLKMLIQSRTRFHHEKTETAVEPRADQITPFATGFDVTRVKSIGLGG